MTELNLDPFPSPEEYKLSETEMEELFNAAKTGDEEAEKKFLQLHAKYIEQLILQHQYLNIEDKYTFTELFEIAIKELKSLMQTDYKNFNSRCVWVIRQSLLLTLRM
jgi:hemerythrin-like domain-containing protein